MTTLIGYARVSKADGSQVHDLQRDALAKAGVTPAHIYEDSASGRRDDRPGLTACLKALRAGDTLVVWKLDRLGRDLRHLVNLVGDLTTRQVGLKVLSGEGASIDTTTANGRLVFAIFAGLAEFERELICERVRSGMAAARARGKQLGRRLGQRPKSDRLAPKVLALIAQGRSYRLIGRELGLSKNTVADIVRRDRARHPAQ